MSETKTPSKAGRILRKTAKIFLIIIGSLLGLVILIALLIQTAPVQNFARKKVQSYMSSKLDTRFEIGKIAIGFPKMVVLENVYVEDRQKDTLLSGGKIYVDISMFKLLKGQVEINDIELADITAKIKRVLPDTVFNFQFIVDAFTPANPSAPNPQDTAALQISLNTIELDRVRLVMKDDVTGNNITAWIGNLETTIDAFEPDRMHYAVKNLLLENSSATIYQVKPLVTPEPLSQDLAEATQPVPFDLDLGEIILRKIKLDYSNDVSAFYTDIDLGELETNAEQIDLAGYQIRLDKLDLNNTTAVIRLGKKKEAKDVVKEIKQEVQSEAVNPWRFYVGETRLDNNNIKFDNDNEPRLSTGMDYAHLDAKALTLHLDDFLFSIDSISGRISKGSLQEKSGFVLNRLESDFQYTSRGAYLRNLVIETPGTSIRRQASVSWPSLESLASNPGLMTLDVDLDNSKVLVKDILVFAPMLRGAPGFKNPNATWLVDGRVSGRVDDMNISELRLSGLSNTRLDVRGHLAGLPDINRLRGNLAINDLRTSRSDLLSVMPAGSVPSNITLPELMQVRGSVSGSTAQSKVNLNINTSLGNATIRGALSNAMNMNAIGYDLEVLTRAINLGRILQNDSVFGKLSSDITIKGKGIDPKTMAASASGNIFSVDFNRYTYKNITLDAALKNQLVDADININDPNIHLAMQANADLTKEFPSVSLEGKIDSIKTLPLHFTTQPLFYRGNIEGDFVNTNPDDLEGNLFLTGSVIATDKEEFRLDTISLVAGKNDTAKFIQLASDVARVNLSGQYTLTQLGYILQDAVQPYFALVPEYKKPVLQPYDFRLDAELLNAPVLQVFVPNLKTMENVVINSRFTSADGWNAKLVSPLIVIGPNAFRQLELNAGTRNNAIEWNTTLQQFNSGDAMHLYNTSVGGKIQDNKIEFLLDIRDINKKDKYMLGGVFGQPQFGNYTLTLDPENVLLNYDKWSIAAGNIVRLQNGDIHVSNFNLSRNEQQLNINSLSAGPNAPLQVDFANFRIATISGFMKQDTLLADGRINGFVQLKDIQTQPNFTSDLKVNDLSFQKDTVGNLALKVSNTSPDLFVADMTLTGRGNDVQVAGTYLLKPANQSIADLQLNIRQLQMKTVEGISMGAIRNASGYLSGTTEIKGTIDDPDIRGDITFNKTAFNVSMLNSYYAIDNEKLSVNNDGILFDSFTIQDSSGNKMIIDGNAYTSNFMNYRFDLDIDADNFKAINSTKTKGQLFYGSLNFDSDLHIGGTEVNPVVDGGLVINENTDFSVVIPQVEPGVVEREGIVRFVDMDSATIDTVVYSAALDSLKKSSITGMNIAVNIEIRREAVFNLIIDEGNGDFLRMKGEALLSAGIDPSGNTTLSGTYEIDEGAYELTFNFIKRNFQIQKGSKITWLGEPTKADLQVTAIYVANTSPMTLVEDQLPASTTQINRYKQKLPFEVHLSMAGELMKPDISFDIILPEEKNYNVSNDIIENVDLRLQQLRSEPSELNKQVFALLLMNRFVSENPFAGGGGEGLNAESFARQSVSKILTQQLNDLAEDLISGVNLNFDVVSTEDYTTGEMQNRTDLNVSLSKELLNDRLKVTVGSNFELEGPQRSKQRSSNIAGDIAADYLLSRDGRYMLRAYRKNEYEGELDGYIIETGVRFIITLDYNHFRDLFRKKKEKELQEKRN